MPRMIAATITVGDRVLLIVENDHGFADVLLEIGRDRGFKGLIAATGSEAQSLIHVSTRRQ